MTQSRWRLAGCVAAAALFGIMQAPAASAAAAQATVAQRPNAKLNGFWYIDEAARRAMNARAQLTPAAQETQRRAQEAQAARTARGLVVGLGSFTCGLIGVPFIVGTSEPWLLVVNDDLVLQAMERRQMTPRYFYTDGRTWPDMTKMPPSSSGYSIARWEGEALVIETRGIPPGGGVQGGGLKGPNTVLTERVSLSPDGNRLTWNYTWTDPDIYTAPHSYDVFYDRVQEKTQALVYECDPNESPGLLVETPAETARPAGAAQ